MTRAKRILLVQTAPQVAPTADPTTWLITVNVSRWLDGSHDAHCTLRKGEGIVSTVQTTPGSSIHTRGLFHPDAIPPRGPRAGP